MKPLPIGENLSNDRSGQISSMFDHLAFVHAGIANGRAGPHKLAVEEGITLANNCIHQLSKLDSDRFPPKLLILLVSPFYLESRRAHHLVEGVHSAFAANDFRDFELIGSSVAAVFFNKKIYRNGALLVCLASRLLEVKVAFSSIAGSPPETSIRELLQQLDLDSAAGEDPNPFANRVLFTLLPGNTDKGYVAADLHKRLRERVWARVPIIGGVSSGFDGQTYHPGLQLFNKQVHKNIVVAARLRSGTLLGMSANDGLERTPRVLQVTSLGNDKRTVAEFDNRSSREVVDELRNEYGFVVLGKSTFNGDQFVESPWTTNKSVRLLRKTETGDAFRVLTVNPKRLSDAVSDGIERSCKSIGLNKPVGCLGFRCSSYLANHSGIGLDLTEEISQVEDKLEIPNGYVGGFVDGEAGKDKQGRSLLRSWSTAAIVFGDELRPRTAVYEGFYKIADFLSRYPSETEPPEKSIEPLLKLIYDIGFPGARLLLVVDDNTGEKLVAPDGGYTTGSLKSNSNVPYEIRLSGNRLKGPDPSAFLAYDGDDHFIPYSGSGMEATSYYFAPLRNIRHKTTAVLQIDVGRKKQLRDVERQLLSRLSIIVGASLTHILNWQKAIIRQRLQEALRASLSETDTKVGVQKYLEGAVKALNLQMGHVRRRSKLHTLELYAGIGNYYVAALKVRPTIDFGDISPTTKAYNLYGTGNVIVINDAQNDPDHLAMLARWRSPLSGSQRKLKRALEEVGSYANIPFASERGLKGTISLVSDQRWFFKYSQRRVLANVAEQIGFLIDHLEQKNAEKLARKEAEEANKRLDFLIGVEPQLAHQNLDDFRGTLAGALHRFCTKTNAEVGSLYLWDQDRDLYVLRAQYGWKEEGWVDGATYNKDAGWFGARALQDEPRHIQDLHEYYEAEGYYTAEGSSKPGGLYAKYMFGQKLSSRFPIEVVGLPLRLGQDNELGVLAMYRTIKSGQPSGFLQTVVEAAESSEGRALLNEAAYNVGGLISALLQHHADRTERDEQERRKRISDELSKHIEDESDESFEELICRSVASAYETESVDYYSLEWQSEMIQPKVVLRANVSNSDSASHLSSRILDTYLKEALSTYSCKVAEEIRPDDILVRRRSLKPGERNLPNKAALEGLVERTCLPLIRNNQLIGLVDLRWKVTSPQPYDAEAHLSKKYLWQLSDDLSKFKRLSIQTRSRIKAEEEARQHLKNQQVLLGQVGAVAHFTHTWRDRITSLINQTKASKEAEDREARETYLDQVLDQLRTFIDDMRELLDLIEQSNLQFQPTELSYLIEAKNNGRSILSKRYGREIKCQIDIPEGLKVNVTSIFIKFAFQNVIDNAIEATDDIPDGFLYITAIPNTTTNFVQVRFSNNGEQIASGDRDAVNKTEFRELNSKGGWGLMIAKCFAKYHDGDFTIETPLEGGTASIFTLPMA